MTSISKQISSAEWELMRVVWTLKTASSREIIQAAQQQQAWSASTIKTLLRRLVQKGALQTQKTPHHFVYSPQITEGQAQVDLAENCWQQICDMKKGTILQRLVQQSPLSQMDIHQLQKILTTKLASAPQSVPCNCLADSGPCCTGKETQDD